MTTPTTTALFASLNRTRNPGLSQFLTPHWAGEQLVGHFLPDLPGGAVVIEPSCGDGALLGAFPEHVHAIGVDIDPAIAAEARQKTGREVRIGDFRAIDLPPAAAVIGNPPFDLQIVDGFLERAHQLLVPDGCCGFLLPAYALQTPSRVLRWNVAWSMQQWALPRTLFPGGKSPLVFVTFRKDGGRRLVGFFLYRETQDVAEMAAWVRQALLHEPLSWRQVVAEALRRLGGTGTPTQIYRLLAGARPTANQWWQAKVRQALQRHFTPIRRGLWGLAGEELPEVEVPLQPAG